MPARTEEEDREREPPAGAFLELAIMRERLAGMERLLEERAERVEELEESLAAEREAATSERAASSQLHVLLRQHRTRAGAIPATTGQEERPPASPYQAPQENISFWDRLRGRAPA